MRLRTIKPGFFKNEALAGIDPLGRILFAGLWCLADRRGRLEDRPLRIKAEILPYDACDVDRLLAALDEAGFIHRYEADDGRRLIEVTAFQAHQRPHVTERESTLPGPKTPKPVKSSAEHGESSARNALSLGSGVLSLGSDTASPPAVAPLPADAGTRAKPRKARESRQKPPSGPHGDFIARWCAGYLESVGEPYAFSGGQDGSAVKAMLEQLGPEELWRRASNVLRLWRTDPWLRDAGISLTILRTQLNKPLAVEGRQPAGTANGRHAVVDLRDMDHSQEI